MSTEITLTDALIDKGSDWASTAWRSLPPRRAGLNWNIVSQSALPRIAKSHDSDPIGFRRSLWFLSSDFHDATKATLWYNPHTNTCEHNHDCEDSTRDHRLNITSLMLAENIAFNEHTLRNKGASISLPPKRITTDLDYYKSTKTDWYHSRNEGKDSPLYGSVESHARWTIENAWHSLKKESWSSKDDPALRWENTAMCAVDAVYNSIDSLDRAVNPDAIIEIAGALHRDMIKHELWGDDTFNSDRANPQNYDKTAKDFSGVSKEMKENYVLITLATLSGISDFMTSEYSKPAASATAA